MVDQQPVPRRRRALREENARLRALIDHHAAEFDALKVQLETLRGENREALARIGDAQRATEAADTQLVSWRKYADALLRTTSALQQWVEWYTTALTVREQDARSADARIAQLQAQVESISHQPVVEPDPGMENALREQIADLRARLDHAAELVDHVVRRLVSPGSPPPAEPTRTRLHLPLIQESFTDFGAPIDLVEEYPLLRAQPPA